MKDKKKLVKFLGEKIRVCEKSLEMKKQMGMSDPHMEEIVSNFKEIYELLVTWPKKTQWSNKNTPTLDPPKSKFMEEFQNRKGEMRDIDYYTGQVFDILAELIDKHKADR